MIECKWTNDTLSKNAFPFIMKRKNVHKPNWHWRNFCFFGISFVSIAIFFIDKQQQWFCNFFSEGETDIFGSLLFNFIEPPPCLAENSENSINISRTSRNNFLVKKNFRKNLFRFRKFWINQKVNWSAWNFSALKRFFRFVWNK